MPRIENLPPTQRKQQNLSFPERMHNKFLKLPSLVQGAFWAGIGCAAIQGLRAYNNEGFINDVVCVPIIEEIAFRGILQPAIKKAQEVWNRYRGTKIDETSTRNRVLASSLLFGLIHNSPRVILDTTWNLGRGCGYLKEKTGSLFAPIALHMQHNLIAVSFLKNYIPQVAIYPALFYCLGKKPFPIPDFITKPIQAVFEKLRPAST